MSINWTPESYIIKVKIKVNDCSLYELLLLLLFEDMVLRFYLGIVGE